MNEFEWLRQSRDLAQPSMPERDLWPNIHARITGHHVHGRHSRSGRMPWLAAAAVLALSVIAGGLSWRLALNHNEYVSTTAPSLSDWRPHDPRLTGAAVELKAAHQELEQAMKQSPRAAYLHNLVERTQHQRARLEQLDDRAG